MENIKRNKFIGKMFDLLFKHFNELEGKVLIDGNSFYFKTPYVGKHNWIKILVPNVLFIDTESIQFEYQINSKILNKTIIEQDEFLKFIDNFNIIK